MLPPEDGRRVAAQFRKAKLGEPVRVADGVTATYWPAGHMLGSSSIELDVAAQEGSMKLLFSGDLGAGGSDYSPDPEGPRDIDHLVLESTYGDRVRPPLDGEKRRAMLARELSDAHEAGGPLLLPAFAVERSQELLADILILMADGQAPRTGVGQHRREIAGTERRPRIALPGQGRHGAGADVDPAVHIAGEMHTEEWEGRVRHRVDQPPHQF